MPRQTRDRAPPAWRVDGRDVVRSACAAVSRRASGVARAGAKRRRLCSGAQRASGAGVRRSRAAGGQLRRCQDDESGHAVPQLVEVDRVGLARRAGTAVTPATQCRDGH
eukprot:scaffold6776_cov42-Phaeocystis_antarctica.AAC.2